MRTTSDDCWTLTQALGCAGHRAVEQMNLDPSRTTGGVPEPTIPESEKTTPASDRVKMLLVDDDHTLVRSLAALIGGRLADTISLHETSDPVAAKDFILAEVPDLVLTDLEMPTVDGFEILRCARRCNPLCQVIVHTGHVSADALLLALKLEATDYLPKSVGPEALLKVIESTCDRILRWSTVLQARRDSA